MRKVIAFSILLVFCLPAMETAAQTTGNVYSRVVELRVGDKFGTAFTLDVDGRQYLITAGHMVAGLKKEDSVDIYRDDQPVPVSVKVLRCEKPIDIAVLIPPRPITASPPLMPISDVHDIVFGQDIFFAGFPYGLSTYFKGLSMPVVKKGILTAEIKEGKTVRFLIGGFNNHGFSGGPVVFRDSSQPKSPLYVLGVIAGFRPILSTVMTPEKVKKGEDISKIPQWRIETLADGEEAILRDTDKKVVLNSGIIIAYSIKHAIDLIRKNPFGPKVSSRE